MNELVENTVKKGRLHGINFMVMPKGFPSTISFIVKKACFFEVTLEYLATNSYKAQHDKKLTSER